MHFYLELGLFEFRKSHELYQADIAEILGITQSAVSRMEKEKIDLTRSQMEKLYEKFGREDVDSFISDAHIASGNVMNGNGSQNNGVQINDTSELVSVIKNQNQTICRQLELQNDMLTKYASQNDRLMSLLEKLTLQ